MTKKIKNLLFFLIPLFIAFCFASVFIVNWYKMSQCNEASEYIFASQDYPVMRINLYGSSEDFGIQTFSGSVAILDSAGVEIARIERSWKKDGIELVFRKAVFNGKTFYFPKLIQSLEYDPFSNSWKKSGSSSDLTRYYMEDGECLLYNSSGDENIRNSLNIISSYSLSLLSGLSNGACCDYRIDLTQCEKGKIYTVIMNRNGELLLIS